MSRKVFRSPRCESVVVATMPSKLAREGGRPTRWRQRTNAELEVAILRKDGYVERWSVDADGSTTDLGASAPPATYFWGAPVALLGIVLFGGTILVQIVLDWSGRALGQDGAGVTVLVGFTLVGIGSWANYGAKDIDSRLKKLSGRKAGWNEPTNLAGWMPRSSAQLHAVEEIADSHDGVAFVRDVGTRIAEVYAKAGRRFERYWVHESGDAELLEQRLGGRFTIGDQHVKRLRNDGLPWHTIRTWIEENDGG